MLRKGEAEYNHEAQRVTRRQADLGKKLQSAGNKPIQ
jgi:hypothetical protein